MGTTASGVGIHATNRPWSVGYFVSHGCIRMLPHEIEQLFPQVQVGTPVKIIYRPIKLALTPQGRVYLEANPNIYEWELHSLEWVKDMAEYYNITDRIDWDKVPSHPQDPVGPRPGHHQGRGATHPRRPGPLQCPQGGQAFPFTGPGGQGRIGSVR